MTSCLRRKTKETDIEVKLDLAGGGVFTGTTGNGFFDHVLGSLIFYSGFDLDLSLKGDFNVCQHHSFEDFGLLFGKTLREEFISAGQNAGQSEWKSSGQSFGMTRYACVHVPMDESLVRVVLDISGRPFLQYNMVTIKDRIGEFETETLKEFLRALVQGSQITLHIEALYGENSHHLVEAMFKAVGMALREAIQPHSLVGPRSTKGLID